MIDDLAEDKLIDVHEFGLSELRDEMDESSFASALDRIFAPDQEVGYHGFNSSI